MYIKNLTLMMLAGAVALPAVAQEDMAGQDADSGKAYVRMETTLGDMTIELDREKAPATVANFLSYADEGFYEGTIFHRVIKDFMAQGGGRLPDYEKKAPTRDPIKNEADNGLKNEHGTIAMARMRDPHSASSQFFINVADNRFLNHRAKTRGGWGYCVFGRVIDGLDTLDKIENAPVKMDPKADARKPARPEEAIVIKKVERVEPSEIQDAIAAARAADANRKTPMEEGQLLVKSKGVDISKAVTTGSGLWYADSVEGSGESPEPSDNVKVHYTGWLTDGTKFDSSHDRSAPATFRLNGVIKGWTEGVGSMKVGGKRFLVIPPDLAYGERGRPGKIPPNSVLVFEIELLEIVE